MEFSEEQASAIIARHGLAPKTKNMWRLRGSIPNKYADLTYQVRKTASSPKDKLIIERIKEALRAEGLNYLFLERVMKLRRNFLSEMKRGKITPTHAEIVIISRELNRLATAINSSIDQQNASALRLMLKDDRIKHYIVTHNAVEEGRLVYFIEKESENYLSPSELSAIECSLRELAKQITI